MISIFIFFVAKYRIVFAFSSYVFFSTSKSNAFVLIYVHVSILI